MDSARVSSRRRDSPLARLTTQEAVPPHQAARSCWACRLQDGALRRMAAHPTSPLSYGVNLLPWSVPTAEYSPCQRAPSCRVSKASIAAMPRRQSLRFVSPKHRRFRPVGCSRFSVSSQGGVPPCPSTQSISQRRRRAASHGAALPLRPHAALLHKAVF
jgi:hypothetical protein